MDAEDRTAALSSFNLDDIDVEFLPFLERINRFPHVVSMQCCLGHVEHESRCDECAKQSGRWG
jgi:tRNA(Phe) wybutosine-synthesizing methylase Tyw3